MLISRLNSNNSFGNILAQEGPGEMVISGEVNQNAYNQLGSEWQLASIVNNFGQDFRQSQSTERVQLTYSESRDFKETEEFHMVRDFFKLQFYFYFLA